MTPSAICILRLSALGDASHVVPVVRELQRHWPETRLTWIIGRIEHQLVADLPGVEFIVFDKRGGLRAVRELRAALRGRRFDVLLLMQLALRANLLSACVRASVRVGFDRARSRELHSCFINRRIPPMSAGVQHVLDALMSFLVPLGLPVEPPRWDLPISAEVAAWAAEQLPGTQRTLVISPCSSRPWRNWHAAGYAAVAEHAARQHGFRIALCGGPTALERSMGDTILAHLSNTPVTDLIGRSSIKQLLALLQRASVVLTPDAGPMHLANAIGTPVIGLHAASDSRRAGPYSDRRYCVDKFGEATRRFLGRERDAVRWGTQIKRPEVMELIAVDEAIAAFDRFAADVNSPRK